MGDRHEFSKKCPNCGHLIECYFTDSSGIKTVLCSNCKTRYELVLNFKLIEKTPNEDMRLEVTKDWIEDKAVELFVILNILKPSKSDIRNVKTFIRSFVSVA